MNCHEFEDRMHAALDDRRDPAADAALIAHASDCVACQGLLSGQRVLFAGLARLALPAVGSEFSDRVVQAVVVEPARAGAARPAARLWLAACALAASAAAVLLAISLVWYARSGGLALAPEAAPHPAPAGVGPEHKWAVEPRDAAPRRRATKQGLAMTQRNLLIQAPRLPQHFRGGYRGAIDTLAVSLPETALHLQDVERIAPGIRPIRVTLSMLWEAFCRAIPGGAQNNEEPRQRPRTSLSSAVAVQFA